jgi:DNA polymerase-3 subunit beta
LFIQRKPIKPKEVYMKVKITQTNLNKALSLMARVASVRAPLPILANILFKATENKLELSATNLEVAITNITKSKIDDIGEVTVPAKLLSDFVAQLPKDEIIELSFEGNKLSVQAGSYSSHIQGMSAEDFPALPKIKEGKKIILNKAVLKDALQKTMLAASHDETRPVLGGIYLHSADGKLNIAATDGYRLAEYAIDGIEETFSAIIPLPSFQDTLKIMQEGSEAEIEVLFDEEQFGVVAGETELVSRLIEGQYPEYKQLIPEKSDIEFTLDRESLLTASKLAGLFARESGGSITIKVSESDNLVTVSSVASQVGDNSSDIQAEVTGSGSVVLNVRYLTDALNCFEGNKIKFRFSGSISPCILTDPENGNYQHVVMPLKS